MTRASAAAYIFKEETFRRLCVLCCSLGPVESEVCIRLYGLPSDTCADNEVEAEVKVFCCKYATTTSGQAVST